MRDRLSVFLLDDHEIVRRGVRDLLEAELDLTVVGEAGTADDAVSQVLVLDPDVAILDVRLQDGDGISACREIRSRHPRTACLILTSFNDDEALLQAILAGASGYVLKQIRSTDLVDAVRRVGAGENLLDPALTRRVMDRLRRDPTEDELIADLSLRERELLSLLAEGLTNRQIADRLYLAGEDDQEPGDVAAVEDGNGAPDRGRALRRAPSEVRVLDRRHADVHRDPG